MLQKQEYQSKLELFSSPTFTAKNHIITLCNSLALSAGFTPGMNVLDLFTQGHEEYKRLSQGCLCATMELRDTTWIATVVPIEDMYLFRVDQEGINPQLKSLMLMAFR